MGEIKAVVFDLYGTLVRFSANERKPFRQLFTTLGLTPAEMKEARMLSMTQNFESFQSLAEKLRPGCIIDCEQLKHDLDTDIDHAILFPEVIGVLKGLKDMGLRLGLISNLATPYKRVVYNFKLDEYFEYMVFSCDVGLVKPDPRIYQIMISRLGLEPQCILMTGDQFIKDVGPPRDAGMKAVHLNRSGSYTEGSIASLKELFQYL
ncbi:MAG: HAD family hydrolase [Candidatus Buchananbacteria bacterium]|jgi:HAD superfamily hydrolase (TIGR01493 family)